MIPAMHRPSKLLFPALALSLALASCGGSSSTAVSCKDQYWDGTVALCVPTGWSTMDQETMRQRGLGEETIVVLQSDEAVSGQFPTFTVTREYLGQEVDAPAYENESTRLMKSAVAGYKQIDSRATDLDGKTMHVHVFSGQLREGSPQRRYYQLSTAANKTGFTFMVMAPLSVPDTLQKQINLMFDNVSFRQPKAS